MALAASLRHLLVRRSIQTSHYQLAVSTNAIGTRFRKLYGTCSVHPDRIVAVTKLLLRERYQCVPASEAAEQAAGEEAVGEQDLDQVAPAPAPAPAPGAHDALQLQLPPARAPPVAEPKKAREAAASDNEFEVNEEDDLLADESPKQKKKTRLAAAVRVDDSPAQQTLDLDRDLEELAPPGVRPLASVMAEAAAPDPQSHAALPLAQLEVLSLCLLLSAFVLSSRSMRLMCSSRPCVC